MSQIKLLLDAFNSNGNRGMYSMKTLSHCFIVGHVHDEMIIEADRRMSVQEVCQQMSRTPAWAEGLILRAEGFECEFYRKE